MREMPLLLIKTNSTSLLQLAGAGHFLSEKKQPKIKPPSDGNNRKTFKKAFIT